MVNDPVGDMLAQIKNASMAKKKVVQLPFSRLKLAVSQLMQKEGYLSGVEKVGTDPKAQLKIVLRYKGRESVITDIKRKSKPGLRKYVDHTEIPTVVGGMGVAIVSTSQGIMSGNEAKKKGIGGELICELW